MARIIGGSGLGMISGKLAGNVFAHNRGGQYIRQYVAAINPNTVSQVNARANFTQQSQAWRGLTAIQKSSWNAWAASDLRVNKGKAGVTYSGFNAFLSCRNQSRNGNRLGLAVQPTVNGGALSVPATFFNFSVNNNPPLGNITSNVKEQVTGEPIPLGLSTPIVHATGSFGFVLDIGPAITAGVDVDTWNDINGNPMAFKVCISNVLTGIGSFVQNPDLMCLGIIKPMSLAAADCLGMEYLTWTGCLKVNPLDFKSFPAVGNVVLFTLYCVGIRGTQTKIGSEYITIIT